LRSDGTSTPGYRDFRGGVETSGRFALNDKWTWGWDGTLVSDRTFFQDYSLGRFRSPVAVFSAVPNDAVSQLYLTGVGRRSFFDVRTMYFYGFSEADVQRQIPIVHPVIDYANVYNRPVFGGELSFKANLTSLSREAVSYNPISATAQTMGLCLPGTADPTVKTPANCLLRGIAGNFTRLSGEATGGAASLIRSARFGRRSPPCAPTSITPTSRTTSARPTSCPRAISTPGA
jgi:LPS-assembly protein